MPSGDGQPERLGDRRAVGADRRWMNVGQARAGIRRDEVRGLHLGRDVVGKVGEPVAPHAGREHDVVGHEHLRRRS